MSTPDWLQAMRARCAAATPGPWQVCPDENTDGDLPLVCLGQGEEHGGPICTHPLTPEDADFIAHARADVPALLALTEALAGALDAAEYLIMDEGVTRQAQAVLARYREGPGATTGGGT